MSIAAVELGARFDVVFLSHVPVLSVQNRNEVRSSYMSPFVRENQFKNTLFLVAAFHCASRRSLRG